MNKLKELDNKLKKEIDLKEMYPGYFNKGIFLTFFIILLGVAVTDVFYNGFDFKDINYKCNNIGGFCPNPFYNNTAFPDWVCEKVPCDQEFLEGGFKVGRDDFLAKNRTFIAFTIIFLSFIFNHLFYWFKYGSIKYKGKEWHLQNKE